MAPIGLFGQGVQDTAADDLQHPGNPHPCVPPERLGEPHRIPVARIRVARQLSSP